MPTVRRTFKKKGKGNHCAQGRCGCKGCKKQTVFACSVCMHTTNPEQKQFWFCNPTMVEGSKCFTKHIHAKHNKANGGGGNRMGWGRGDFNATGRDCDGNNKDNKGNKDAQE
jgi:hypothetical protein